MASLDVESLFMIIPLKESIKICCDSFYKNQELLSNISKNQFEKLLRAALSNNFFLFDCIIYQQVDGVVRFPFGGKFSQHFLLAHEQIWVNVCQDDFKPINYKRYMGNMFLLFLSPRHLKKLASCLTYRQIKGEILY